MQATSDTLCPLYTLDDDVTVLKVTAVISREVSFVRSCTASCSLIQHGKHLRVEREDTITAQPTYRHDYHHHLQFCQGSTIVPGFIIYIHSDPSPSPCIPPLRSPVNLCVPPLCPCPLNPPSQLIHAPLFLCIHLSRILPLMLY